MSLEKKIKDLLYKISNVNKVITSALKESNDPQIKDIRYSLVFINELEIDINDINEELDMVNEGILLVNPTKSLEKLREELVEEYDKMYVLFDNLAQVLNPY